MNEHIDVRYDRSLEIIAAIVRPLLFAVGYLGLVGCVHSGLEVETAKVVREVLYTGLGLLYLHEFIGMIKRWRRVRQPHNEKTSHRVA